MNGLCDEIKSSVSASDFKVNYLKYSKIRPKRNDYFNINDRYGLILLTRLQVDFSDLRIHRFNHHFNCVYPICKCPLDESSTEHFLLRCPRFAIPRRVMLESISDIIHNDIEQLPIHHVAEILLFGSSAFNRICNKLILECTIRFIKSSKRFEIIEAFNES